MKSKMTTLALCVISAALVGFTTSSIAATRGTAYLLVQDSTSNTLTDATNDSVHIIGKPGTVMSPGTAITPVADGSKYYCNCGFRYVDANLDCESSSHYGTIQNSTAMLLDSSNNKPARIPLGAAWGGATAPNPGTKVTALTPDSETATCTNCTQYCMDVTANVKYYEWQGTY